jgi:hypothetical protein
VGIAENSGAHHILLMRVAVLMACLLMASPAMAGKTDPTWNPPKRFDHAYPGKLVVHRMPQTQIVNVCEKLLGKRSMIQHGCSVPPKNSRCEIWIVDKTYMGATPEAVIRHETGHCNGWPADHPV